MPPAVFGWQTEWYLLMSATNFFDVNAVLSAARNEAKLEDFGELTFIPGLTKLLECAREEIHFTPEGKIGFEVTVRRWLVNRLRYVEAVKQHPEILAEDVSDPIVIIGMPRTGTTKFQRFLSADPNNFRLSLWMTLNPAVFPGEEPGNPRERIAFAEMIAAQQNNPDFLTSHERTPEDAEEDSDLLLFSIDYMMVHILCPTDSLMDWLRQRPRLPAYQLQNKLLQYLQWQQGGRHTGETNNRRWVLKNPGHIGQMDALSQVYPNATIVHLHRNLLEVLPSYCRLIQSLYQVMFNDIDPHEIGRQALRYWGPEFRRQAEQREQLRDKLNIIDVSYLDVVKNPMALAETLYQRAGHPLTELGRRAMEQWNRENGQHKHGKPSYSLEQYGLTESAIEAAFGTLDNDF